MNIRKYSIEPTNGMQPEIDKFSTAMGNALDKYLCNSGLDLMILFNGRSNKLSLDFSRNGDVVYGVDAPISTLLNSSQSQIENDARCIYQMLQDRGFI